MISIIVLVHNRVALTRLCLASLAAAYQPEPIELLLVDNASREDVRGLAGEFAGRFASLEVLRNDRNDTFALACNRAAGSAAGDWLLFLNNDVEVAPTCLAALARARSRWPQAGVFGATLHYPDTGRLQHAGLRQMLWGYVSNWGVGAAADDERFAKSGEVFAVTGALAWMDRALFERAGGFDEAYRWGYEDVDLCLRAAALGRPAWFVHDAVARHHESATLRAVREPRDLQHNYRHYRARWDHVLVPREQQTLAAWRDAGIRRVVILGTGQAARGLADTLRAGGIDIVAFTRSGQLEADVYCECPVVPLERASACDADRLVYGTQAFSELEALVARSWSGPPPIVPCVD